MPVISIKSNITISPEKRMSLFIKLANQISKIVSKDPKMIMISYNQQSMYVAESQDNCAFVEAQNIGGFSKEQCSDMCLCIYHLFQEFSSISTDRIFFSFSKVQENGAWKFLNNKPVSLI